MDIEKLTQRLHKAKEQFHIPSFSVTLMTDGNLTDITSGFGDVGQAVPARPDTLYAIGSCTKSFVAGALCALADQGKLSLEDCVQQYIPEFAMYDRYVSEHLTIRDMLCHRCGLPRHEVSWYARMATLTSAQLVESLRYLRPNAPFRYTWQYNNQMYVLAGLLLERITGENWRNVVTDTILAPLGIAERTAFSPAEAKRIGAAADPFEYDAQTERLVSLPHAQLHVVAPAGALYLSSHDLAIWAQALLQQGESGGKRIISSALCRQMQTPQMIQGAAAPEPLQGLVHSTAYGLGLMTEVYRGRRLVHHGGYINGFMADFSFFPDEGFGCSVLTNLGITNAAKVMRYIIADHMLGCEEDWSNAFSAFFAQQKMKQHDADTQKAADRPKQAPCPVPLAAICGKYEEPGYGNAEITEESDMLKFTIGMLTFTGRHYANQYFTFTPLAEFPGEMTEGRVDVDAQGRVAGFAICFDPETGEKIQFTPKKEQE